MFLINRKISRKVVRECIGQKNNMQRKELHKEFFSYGNNIPRRTPSKNIPYYII